MDMNVVFQEFVTVAMRDALGVSERVFRERNINPLDTEGRVNLKPDLTWWHGSSCVFVGDAKYKNITGERVPNADLYQLLAYTTAPMVKPPRQPTKSGIQASGLRSPRLICRVHLTRFSLGSAIWLTESGYYAMKRKK